VEVEEVRATVGEWIFRRPLRHLGKCRRKDVPSFLSFVEAHGMKAGVFSDYPAVEKLAALGLDSQISLALCATDPE
jgi:phosphoglycolate phosphatase/putative hydrolase of the HAD superfamily